MLTHFHFTMIFLLAAVTICLVCLLMYCTTLKSANFPPGPRWLPLVGCAPEVKKLVKVKNGFQHAAFFELAKTYKTDVLGLKLGGQKVVVVFSRKLIKQVLTCEEFDGRPDDFFMRLRCLGERIGITGNDGPVWLDQKKFLLKQLHEMGAHMNRMDWMIGEEVQDVLEKLKCEGASGIKIREILSPSIINVLWSLVASKKKVGHRDARLKTLLDLMRERSKVFDMCGGILNQFPWLRHIFPNLIGYNLIINFNQRLQTFFEEIIFEHERIWYDGLNDDLIFSYLDKIGKETDGFTRKQLLMVCMDLFIAGSHSTGSTLDFAFLAMLIYPEVQEKVRETINSSIDPSIPICYTDRLKVPYVEAVLCEIQRLYTVAPLIGPRRTLRDVWLGNYLIPRNTTVIAHVHSIYNSSDVWPNVQDFKPDRFLNQDGFFTTNDALTSFGQGHRRCPGELLAKKCIFVVFSEVIRNFKIEKVAKDRIPTGPGDSSMPGLLLSPCDYRASFVQLINV